MDNKTKTGTPDRDRINLSEDYEVQYWADKFGVTAEQLTKAVKKVGDAAKNVEEFLTKGKIL
jgi:hypothetical protein